MVNSEKQQSTNDRGIDDVDQTNAGGSSNNSSSPVVVSLGTVASSLPERVGESVEENRDGDQLLQPCNWQEDNDVLRFLLALDVQVIGACRADERLKPLLKLNMATGAAEDRLLAHLSQHFEPAEIGMLARCLYIPLVSIRVGKINKQGNLLSPTDKRGSLNLTLLPTSDMRLSFTGDDGQTERLSTLSCGSEFSTVEIEGIPVDKSGRSFRITIHESVVFYFWCSEKSKLLGAELLRKMKDLLNRKPSLAELTGISESRLESFAVHLRAYLAGSSVTNAQTSHVQAMPSSLDSSLVSLGLDDVSAMTSVRSSRSRLNGSQSSKSSLFNQGSLSPRSSSFKEGAPRNSYSLRSAAKEKLRRRGDGNLSCVGNLTFSSSISLDLSSSNCSEKDKLSEANGTCLFPPVTSLESIGRLADPSLPFQPTQISSSSSTLFSPYYCWCPPGTATLPYTKSIPQLPVSSSESLSLPSLSSLLSSAPALGGTDFPSLDFLPLIPDPLVRSQLAMPSSQQIPTFTPLMCDPIVHIPVIDVCSSVQGLLVSAGPTISSTIPPLHPNLVTPLIPEAESMVDKGARETLRWLINSSSSNQPNLPMDVLPSLVINGDPKHHNILVAGSRGLYAGTEDVNALTNLIAAMESQGPLGDGVTSSRGISSDDLMDILEEPSGSSRPMSNDGPSNVREGTY